MSTLRASSFEHVRPVQPLRFPAEEPESETMGQSTRHVKLCKALYEMLVTACGPDHTIGFDNFVYFDASNPKRKLAPDAFVKLGVPDHEFESYLVWEEGTPDVAFEVLSPSDTPEKWTFAEKLRRYLALGVRELVAIDIDAPPGRRLRVWDRIEQDLVERVVDEDRTPCLTLGLTLLVGPMGRFPVAPRIARDAQGTVLVPTDREARDRAEAQRDEAQAHRDEVRAHRDEVQAQRDAAQARVAELEALLGEERS